ncbi:glucosaminidase domain-containing protein [Actinokineospora sp. NBRC 105648]|uniref:glucosaminidase domain-containing protein n=1 Tax=Actinokineospora sp. NBRC 105648 TaxID=3032206 RepID=UPI0024A0D8FE|nr:glucosaminidase domain-containing protein [Actinokineospora sp. NBRC 105648]GLZ43104.1 glucosaminidase [Actinokineospora sp. NBRC 105648]
MRRRHRITTGLAAALLLFTPGPAAADSSARVDQDQVRHQALGQVDDEYLRAAEPAARAVAGEFGIPASVTAGQSILESAWGSSRLAVNDRNYFGFKCTASGPGPMAVGCHDYPTTECGLDPAHPDACTQVQALFRVYDSMTASFRDYGRLMTTSDYYAAALPLAHDPDAFATEVAKHYATDPDYAAKVIRVMRDHDLYRLDRPLP